MIQTANALEEARRAIQSVLDQITLQRDLIAVEDRDYSFRAAPCDVREVVAEVARLLADHPAARHRGVRIETGADREIFTDRLLLSRMVRHMVLGLLEAEPRQGEIVIGCDAGAGGGVQIWVRHSAALSRESLADIFRRWTSNMKPGPGLRTYSMRLITEIYLKGSMIFRSEDDFGTEFRALLPASAGER